MLSAETCAAGDMIRLADSRQLYRCNADSNNAANAGYTAALSIELLIAARAPSHSVSSKEQSEDTRQSRRAGCRGPLNTRSAGWVVIMLRSLRAAPSTFLKRWEAAFDAISRNMRCRRHDTPSRVSAELHETPYSYLSLLNNETAAIPLQRRQQQCCEPKLHIEY